MAVVAAPQDAEAITARLAAAGETVHRIGEIAEAGLAAAGPLRLMPAGPSGAGRRS